MKTLSPLFRTASRRRAEEQFAAAQHHPFQSGADWRQQAAGLDADELANRQSRVRLGMFGPHSAALPLLHPRLV